MIMEEEDIDLGYLLQESIRKIASNEANVFTLGHCNLITALCRANNVPEEGEDDGELEPIKALDAKYFYRYKAGPVANNQGVNVAQGVHQEEEHVEAAHADDQGMDDVMEEIDRFDSGALPNQQQQSGDWPYTHSEHELASLLHNLDLNTHFRLPNVYYNTQGQMYTEA
ncbi:hypothetical protein A2U01_0039230, partial [Trifolium medium]|nr:hypothetical protein [Trifolium medium]